MDSQSAEDTVDIDLEKVSSSGEAIGDLGDDVTELELNLACFSEKVANLSNFVMQLETLGVELEGLGLDKGENDVDMDCIVKFLEFDLLCGVLGSVVVELDRFLDTLHTEISYAGERDLWQDKLLKCEQCLKLSEEQFSEIKKQYGSLQRTLSCYKRGGNVNAEEVEIILENDQSLNVNTIINMQTSEEQRNVLRMLEKSLANEMDLEKKFNDSRQVEEKLKLRVASLEQELIFLEEESTDAWERLLEADNAREILMGISKQLLGKFQISQFNMNGLSQRESELRAKLEISIEKLKERDATLNKIESDKVCSLEQKLKESECQLESVKATANEYQKQYNVLCCRARDMEEHIAQLKETVSIAESHANTLEAQCKLLTEGSDGGKSERVESLERQLRESDLQLQHAVASAEASQEKQSMLYSTIKDMEHVIKDLKSKVSKAESRADSAEEKCIMLSESNSDLNEELSFLRSRLECLEGSLHQMEESKVASAKDIGKQTKVFKNLVMQLAVERERLNKQMAFLVSENKILVVKLKETDKHPSQEVSVTLATDHEVGRTQKNSSTNDNEVKYADSMPDVDTVRRIDAGVLDFKHLFMLSVLALLFSVVTYLNIDVNI